MKYQPSEYIELKAADIEVEGVSIGATTYNIDVGRFIDTHNIGGSTTLTSSLTIGTTGTLKKGMSVDIVYTASMVLDGNNITIFGRQLTQSEASSDLLINMYYDGSAYQVTVVYDSSNSEIQYSENLDVDTGTEVIDSFADTTSNGCMWIVSITNGTASRTSQILATWDATTDASDYAELKSPDIGGATVGVVTLGVTIDSDNVKLTATVTSDNWIIKAKRITL